ncbi:MAG: ribonucleoside reductase class II [Elusimicrobia bacterium]|nr:ribonucleoside reductase class II [Elusimicrobiota bacterium]
MKTPSLERKKIAVSENQAKVIKDKYLREETSIEELFARVSHNIALAELIFHPDAEKWGIFEGVTRKIIENDPGGKRSKTTLFHEPMSESEERDANFKKLLKNLEKARGTIPEAARAADYWQTEFYNLMADFDFLPNSPTLMNAGRELQQLSACYVLPVPDSMEGIAKALTAQSLIQKSGGGTGFSFGRVRPKGDIVKKTNGVASGAVSFMKLFDKMTDVVKQGGTRRGANMGILPYWHPEIKEFITLKAQAGVMENFNISVALDDKFMKAVDENGFYNLLNPRTGEVTGAMKAKEIFNMLVDSAWAAGDPGIVFMDRINETNSNPTPALGRIESTNPCFAGSMRLAMDRGLLTFEELFIDQTEITVATDNRVPGLRAAQTGGTAVAVKTAGTGGGKETGRGTCVIPTLPQPIPIVTAGVTSRKAVPVFKTRKDWPVFTLTTEHGFKVTATEDHKFFTPEGLKALKDLKPGDELLIQSGPGIWSRNYDLPPFTAEDKLKARITRGEARLPKQWSRELGELLGWAVGDGWVSETKPEGRNVPNYTIGLMYGNEEKKLLAPKFRALIREWTGLEGTETERRGTLMQQYRSALYYFLNSLGIHEKNGLHKQVPEALWRAPREAVLGFLSALFTADGTVNVSRRIRGSIRLANSSKKLLEETQLLLLNEGIVSQIYLRRTAGTKMMPDSKRQPKLYAFSDQYELVITRQNRVRFLKEIGFLTPSKQNKAMAFENALTRGAYQESFTTQVKTIRPAGRTDVYCTTEPETHSLICGGIISGNCGEQPLLPWESCNLGSLNLSNFVKGEITEGEIDFAALEETVSKAVRFLDNVIEVNNYPLPEIERIAKGNRKIGLGVMGWAETAVKLGLAYDSHAALKKAEEVMKFIDEKALAASEELAKERGVFPNWKDSIYDAGGKYFRGAPAAPRNASRTTIAPTGTIAIAAGLQGSGIEPFFAVAYTRYNARALDAIKAGGEADVEDTFFEVNPLFRKLAEKHGFFGLDEKTLWKKIEANHKSIRGIAGIPKNIQALFPTAHDVSPDHHIKVQAAFQKHTDNAVSKTINLPVSARTEDVKDCYLLAYKLGCKGLTVYRDGSKAQQVLNITPAVGEGHAMIAVEGSAPGAARTKKKKQHYQSFGVSSEYFQIKTGYGPLHVHINFNENGPYQVFTNMPPLGSELSGLTSLIGILLSKYFEEGGDPIKVIKHLNSVKGDRPIGFGENRINSIAHAISVALRSHLKRTGIISSDAELNGTSKLELWEAVKTQYCPKCYSSNVSHESGCSGPVCHDCGYSECS